MVQRKIPGDSKQPGAQISVRENALVERYKATAQSWYFTLPN